MYSLIGDTQNLVRPGLELGRQPQSGPRREAELSPPSEGARSGSARPAPFQAGVYRPTEDTG